MIYHHDGTAFDLTVPHADVLGVEWHWTRELTAEGEPLMQAQVKPRAGCTEHCCPPPIPERALPLTVIYHTHGPLIPIHPAPPLAWGAAPLDGAEVAA